MDTSPEYVKMCEKAEEIQKLAPLEFGNWYAYLRHKEGKSWGLTGPIVELMGEDWEHQPSHSFTEDIEHCWLPRQDQLQEMVGEYNYCLSLLHDFQCPEVNFPYEVPDFTSMEQLWLAFVMKEKYGKIWDSDKIVWMSG